MAHFIHIYCKSNKKITRHEISKFILDGVFFEEEPRFSPALDDPLSRLEEWRWLEVDYSKGQRPVMFYGEYMPDLIDELVDQIEEVNERKESDFLQRLLKEANLYQQVISIEVNPATLTNEAWEMMDAVEAFLATSLDGFIYAPDDGFFDNKLQRILDLRKSEDGNLS